MSQVEMDQETVYGTHEDSHVVMSEKVQSLAGSIYQEFEKMIARYDEDVVKDLMPLLVNVLECLDISYTENQEREVELELLREDNEQLVTQYEREKQLRKASDQKLFELEDVAEDERKELVSKIDSLESIVRMLELKTKNSHDHVVRLEEKEAEMKREYTRLHERYTELFKTHVDYMERTKMLVGSTERLENATSGRGPSRLPSLGLAHMSRSSGPLSYGFQSLEASINAEDVQDDIPSNAANLRTEMLDNSSEAAIETSDKSQLTDKPAKANKTTAISRHESPETEAPPLLVTPTSPTVEKLATTPSGRSRTEREQRSGNTLYQELSFQDADALGEMDEGADITGSWVHPGEYASSVNDNFFGMGKEVENLIMENNELLATKNALNIVKDDLIVKVDELTSEQEILREEVRGLQQARERLKQRVAALEEELKKVKEEAEAAAKAAKSDDEEDVPLAQRKRFTRVEMARVLMERNQYKERFMELQEAVRWTEMIRASKTDPSSISGGKGSVWKFFSSLFTGPADRGTLVRGAHTLPHIRYSAPTNQVVPASSLDAMRRRTLKGRHEIFDQGDTIASEKLVARRANERREQYRQVRAHVRKEDGRLQAYGWSLPGKPSAPVRQPVPVPVYCRPLQESEPGMKIWCGAGVNLSGGKTRDGGCMIGGSVFYAAEAQEVSSNTKVEAEDAVEHLDKEIQENENQRVEAEQLEQQLSSLVWICTSTQKMSKVTVIDANNPAGVLEVFNVCQGHLLCIASVPGAKESDYIQGVNEEPVRTTNGVNDNDGHEENANVEQINQKNKQETQASSDMSKNESDSVSEEQNNESTESDNTNQNITTEPQSLESVDSETMNLGKVYFVKVNLESPPSRLNEKDDTNEENQNDEVEEGTPIEKMSSIQPTMWLGAQNGAVFVHSAVAKWSVCLHSVKLKDAALAIVHVQGRVLVALADGTVALFRRGADGQWDLSQYHVITLGSPQHSIRCMAAVSGRTVWCGYRNKIHVIDPVLMTVECTVDAHPRRESQVRQLAWLGEGVWVSIRLDSTLRLYHAHTYQHLQDVDIEPYVSKMLGTGKLGFSFVRITALLISSNRLWIGTGNGVIISVPLAEGAGGSMAVSRVQAASGKTEAPGVGVRIFASDRSVTRGSFIPYCSMAHAQLSFHGHRDAVKMFVAVPGTFIHTSYSFLIQAFKVVSLGPPLTRNAVPLRVFHSTVSRHDKSPLLLPAISCCSERCTQRSVFFDKKPILTLAFQRISLRNYCCKKNSKDNDDDMSEKQRDPASEQLNEYKSKTGSKSPVLLTGNGVPIANKKASLTVGPHGPILLQDYVFLDELSHFDRERIPERVVHAKGAGAFGYFEVTNDITKYSKASVFSQVGKRTPIAVRFSSVGGESGSADTVRDPRGFAVKFYTEDGIWDLVGNNTPIFFIKDPLFFPSFIHTQKRNPVTHLKDADMFWDFLSLRPESTHQVLFLFSDRGIPDGHRHMNGYGSHTFKLVNANNEMVYCKFHYKTDQGIKNIPVEKAAELSASDPDYSIRDLYNAIASHQYPTWTFSIQVMTPSQAKNFKWNPFDVTKVWPHKEFPLIPVGKLVLDRNPENYFTDVEQIAFDPAHMIPGIEPSPDKMLQGRLFSYGDTHRHRLGPNHLQLPVNCPFKAISAMNYQRDGLMAVHNQNGAPNYFPNSFNGPKECPAVRPPKFNVSGDVDRYEPQNEDDFGQAGMFYRDVLNADEKKRLVDNIVGSLRNASTFIVERAVKNFTQVDADLGRKLTDGLRKAGVRINVFGKTASL